MEYDPALGQLRSDVLERDARLAAASGADYAVTLGRLRVMEQLDRVVETLNTAYPDTFGGVYWDEGLVLVAQFRGEAPDAAVDRLAGLGLTVKEASVAYSARELERLSNEVRAALADAGVADSVVAVDPKNQRVAVSIGGSTSATGPSETEISQALQGLSTAPVDVEFVDGPVFRPLTVYGGAELWADFQTYECTTRFSVVSQYGGTTGTATAGHCGLPDGPAFYWDWYHGVYHDTTFKAKTTGYWGDFGWYTTTYVETDDFYHDNTGTLRDVTGVKTSFSPNQPQMYYGRTTRTDVLSYVGWTGVSAGGTSNMVCLYSGLADGGDSGGPVYYGGTAAGYITGLVVISSNQRVCFSQAQYIFNGIGVTVKTT